MTGKDLLTRLADAGEEAIAKLAESPGADRFLAAVGGLRDRVDELQRRVRGIEDLERRVAALEARLAQPPATTSPPPEAAGIGDVPTPTTAPTPPTAAPPAGTATTP
ncbi:MAG: hypothetical protein ICV64_06505, partial [Thermoleophilia bacterium]|nr:hypothetical protein [Thermoleophilia bacterium]